MGRDFARKGRHKVARNTESSSHWLWLLSGTLIGMIISSIALFKLFPVIYPKIAQLEPTPVIASIPATAQQTVEKRVPQFDFYSLLPELEVVVPTAEMPEALIAATPITHETTSETNYRIQLGSFRKYEDADRLKAQMALSGIQVEIEAVTLEENDTWYRVRSTPYADRASAESVRSQLQAQSIQSLLVEDKG